MADDNMGFGTPEVPKPETPAEQPTKASAPPPPPPPTPEPSPTVSSPLPGATPAPASAPSSSFGQSPAAARPSSGGSKMAIIAWVIAAIAILAVVVLFMSKASVSSQLSDTKSQLASSQTKVKTLTGSLAKVNADNSHMSDQLSSLQGSVQTCSDTARTAQALLTAADQVAKAKSIGALKHALHTVSQIRKKLTLSAHDCLTQLKQVSPL